MAEITKDDVKEFIRKMSVLELSQLVKELEEEFGVTAAAPMAMPAQVAGVAGGEAAPAEEKTEFDVILKDIGPKKIDVIKAIRQITSLGLKDAKDMAETAGAKVLEQIGKEAAQDAKSKLETAGAVVELT